MDGWWSPSYLTNESLRLPVTLLTLAPQASVEKSYPIQFFLEYPDFHPGPGSQIRFRSTVYLDPWLEEYVTTTTDWVPVD